MSPAISLWSISDLRASRWRSKYLQTVLARANIQGQIWTLRPGYSYEEEEPIYFWQGPSGQYIKHSGTDFDDLSRDNRDEIVNLDEVQLPFWEKKTPARTLVSCPG